MKTDISSLILKRQIFKGISQQELASQIISKKAAENKLNSWYSTTGIIFPNKVNIEQTSSEVTASFKSRLISGKKIIDITGGFGVDSYAFSKKVDHVTHCEIDETLSEISKHNFKALNVKNIKTIQKNGIDYLKESTINYDWIYIDPSRRDNSKGKVFLIEDCSPNVLEHLELLFKQSNNILIKYSPILDINKTINQLHSVKDIHVVAVKMK